MLKVLIADDEVKVSQLILHLIRWEDYGIEVIGSVNDGEEAYEVILRERPDITKQAEFLVLQNQINPHFLYNDGVVERDVLVDITAAPTIIQKCRDAGDIPLIFFNKEISDKEKVSSYDKLYHR